METIGIYEAKTNLSKLIERVKLGESFAITQHGKVVAEVMQPTPAIDYRKRRSEALARIRAMHKANPPPPITLEEILAGRHEGHKY